MAKTPLVTALETHAELTPELARDLDVEIETALAVKARSDITPTHLQTFEFDFEEEASAQNRPLVTMTQAEESELEQALVAAAETESPEAAFELKEDLAANSVVTEEIANNFVPIMQAEQQLESSSAAPLSPQVEQAIVQAMSATPAQPKQQQHVKAVDGFSRPSNLRVPTRPAPRTDARVQSTTPPRGFYIDGIVASRNPAT